MDCLLSEKQLVDAGVTPEQYSLLTEEEKKVVTEVLKEMAAGRDISSSVEQLYYADYSEIPVSFEQFITDDQYLGKSTRHGTFLYPFWRKEATKIFTQDDSVEVALSGSIGIGKTTAACLMMTYHLYRTMCMKDPQSFFGLSPGSVITYAFLNNTLSSSYGVGYGTIQSFLKESPWFLKHGTVAGRAEPTYYPENGFAFIVGSRPQHTLGRHIICALLDEVSFAPGQNVNYEKSKIMDLYTNIRRRMDSRFMVQGKNYGKMFLVSSKATESSFLEAYIADQIKKGYPIYVVDQPLWKVKPAAYSGEFFKVAVGNKFIPSKVVQGETEEEINTACESYKEQGMRIIDVPVEHRQAFDQNIDKALQDIAGISTSVVTKVFSVDRLLKCIGDLENPFRSEIVTLGVDDGLKLQDFFDASKIPDYIKSAPTFIHLDASVSGDRTGLSGVAIIGSRQVTKYGADVDSKEIVDELVCQHVFSVGIQAPTDSEISFEKTRQFVYYLKDEVGLNIKIVTTDGFQSVDTRQILKTKGFEVGYTSLDRKPDGYDGLKSAITDQRIVLLKGCYKLQDELTDLERDNMTRKYDHPIDGSKDIADSLAGAHYDALQYKQEYMFFHPEEVEYEEINNPETYEDQLQRSMLSSITKDVVTPKVVTGQESKFRTVEDIFSSMDDSNILTL